MRRNLWALTVLCLLREKPLHPYEMQRLIRERHKDDFLELKRGSLYHAIERLAKAGLIEEVGTSREGRRPERTTYRLTDAGEREVLEWLRDLLSKPVREPSSFIAALSFVGHLTPGEAADQLLIRARELQCGIVAIDAILQSLVPQIGRVCLIEAEYALAMRKAELEWTRSLIGELREGTLAWGGGPACAGPGD
ncbi:MAG TPA: PadR family transcriptional regulator [Pirellulales bacterium]|jgi:DNA-binding PadR family transcriptional regulator|nr:PadR family transcriptional regulator [Pirellulales bacterium]